MHKKIYKANKNLSSVIHTHSEYLTAVSIIKEEIPAITEEQVVTLGPSIICLDYFPSGSLKLAEETSKYFKKYKGLMLSNHGYVGAGRDIKEAFLNCRIAEKCARIYLKIKPYLKKNMILNKKNIDEYLNRGEK
jgi:L-fuculose-phosphate aldolase